MLVDDLVMALMQGLVIVGEVAQYGLAIALPTMAVFWAMVPASAGAMAQFPHLVETDAVGMVQTLPKRVRPLVEASALLRAERIIARHASRHSPSSGEWIEVVDDGPEWNGAVVVEDQCVLLTWSNHPTNVVGSGTFIPMPVEVYGPQYWWESMDEDPSPAAAHVHRREPFPW